MKKLALCLLACLLLYLCGCPKATSPEFENTVAAVLIIPESGSMTHETQIVMSVSTPEAEIHYSLDGQLPNLNSPHYTAPFILDGVGRRIVKARAFLSGWNPSPVSQAEYLLPHAQPAMVHLAGGSFYNGITQVSVRPFFIDKTEVTQTEYYDVMGSQPVPTRQSAFPIYYVSWFQAVKYCNKRSLLDGLNSCYSYGEFGTNPAFWPANYGTEAEQSSLVSCDWNANGYRLPTEIEWLYAFLGGQSTHYYDYSGSDKWEDVAWCNKNSGYSVHPVAEKSANEMGIYDMSGNLWEWCWDLHQDSKHELAHNSPKSYSRSVRGGSWYSPYVACSRYSSATFVPICDVSGSIGFRCCRND